MMKQHNYVTKIDRLLRAGAIRYAPGSFHRIASHHDDWCDFYRGGRCNCDPDIYFDGQLVVEPKRAKPTPAR